MTTNTAQQQTIEQIKLNKIIANPLNPRKNFTGKAYEDLLASVREKGVLQPIMVRQLPDKKYEIVFGERRWRVSCDLAKENGGLSKHAIPAMVRDLDDNEAFEIMTIENLQRNDITELEEANSFKLYIDRMGDEAVPILAERIGINPAYIRRRVKILELPKEVLEAWAQGSLKYGHLEQLTRVGDKKQVKILFEWMEEQSRFRHVAVRDLARKIDSESPELKSAFFDVDKAGCATCFQNSDVQKSLFGSASDAIQCNNPKCFKQKQNNWLKDNWNDFRAKHKLPTNGFRFSSDFQWNDYEEIGSWQKTPKPCKSCESFFSLVSLTGKVDRPKVCMGDKACFKKTTTEAWSEGKSVEKTAAAKAAGPRVAWHGEHFRDLFFREALPAKIQAGGVDSASRRRLILFAQLVSNRDLQPWFVQRHKMAGEKEIDTWTRLSDEEIMVKLATMSGQELEEELVAAALETFLQKDKVTCAGRWRAAEHLGIDMAQEWAITEEYLDKKTVAEMMAMGESLGIFAEEQAVKFLTETIGKPEGAYGKCKKGELKRVFLESGVNLVGRVPSEILGA
ncbi:MAG: ParB/RepB/Spo0J family partition protein [Proteobacteria bacterium]|nr:ParB/RepB/Spo0J family partition protein [Pseudomonadota bacterium]